jgi:hypothetical protein
MEKIIVLRNEFHNTEVRVKLSTIDKAYQYYLWNNGKLNNSAKKISRKLCGCKGCICGDWIGVRMSNLPQEYIDGV